MTKTILDFSTLSNWLWEAACKIRGEVDAPKYKDYILPIIFIKRLSDVFDDKIEEIEEEFDSKELAEEMASQDHSIVGFYVPPEAKWKEIAKQTTGIGQYLTDVVRALARENDRLEGVVNIVDFNATQAGQRIITDEKLKLLIDVLGRHRLGVKNVEPDIIGRAYEYLLKKFAEGSGQSAGEFYTPYTVTVLMANILNPKPGEEIYDPCCGSGGLLIKCSIRFKEQFKDQQVAPLKFYGQEILHTTFAMAWMNAIIHDMEAKIFLGDTMNNPKFLNNDGSLKAFDVVTSNPMWNQDFSQSVYENDTFNRFSYGSPPSNTADLGWIQHMSASLNKKGRMAVVLDTGAVSRGSGNVGRNRERDIRKEYVDRDLVEAVILLPDNLFVNTTAPGIIMVINKNKKRKDEILLINGAKHFVKGRPKNEIPDESIKELSEIYLKWEAVDGISVIIHKDEVVKNDYNLSPSRYVSQNGEEEVLPLEDAVVLLKEAEEERAEADRKLKLVLQELGLKI